MHSVSALQVKQLVATVWALGDLYQYGMWRSLPDLGEAGGPLMQAIARQAAHMDAAGLYNVLTVLVRHQLQPGEAAEPLVRAAAREAGRMTSMHVAGLLIPIGAMYIQC